MVERGRVEKMNKMDMIIRSGTEKMIALYRKIQGYVLSREENGLAEECRDILSSKGVIV